MTQPKLFSEEPHQPYARGSATSHDAAHKIAPHAGKLERLVLGVYANYGKQGTTRQRASKASGLGLPTICSRTTLLLKLGALEKTGERWPTGSRTGSTAGVVRITQAGAAMLAMGE